MQLNIHYARAKEGWQAQQRVSSHSHRASISMMRSPQIRLSAAVCSYCQGNSGAWEEAALHNIYTQCTHVNIITANSPNTVGHTCL